MVGMNVVGEDRPQPGEERKPTGKRDSTVITIGGVRYSELDLPHIEVVLVFSLLTPVLNSSLSDT